MGDSLTHATHYPNEIARLTALGFTGEHRGHHAEPGLPLMPSAEGVEPHPTVG